MMDVRRHGERGRSRHGGEYVRIAFGPQTRGDALAGDLGVLGGLSGIRLPPAGRFTPGPSDDVEFVTYVHGGALSLEGSHMKPTVAYAGEFLRSATSPGIRREIKASTRAGAHVFRISFRRTDAGLGQASQRARFTAAQRSNRLCTVVSPDARDGSLQLCHDVVVCSSVLDAGRHVAYQLAPQRTVWVHVIAGLATVRDLVLSEGDSVGVSDEPSVSFIAQQSSEILLIDLGPHGRPGHQPSQ